MWSFDRKSLPGKILFYGHANLGSHRNASTRGSPSHHKPPCIVLLDIFSCCLPSTFACLNQCNDGRLDLLSRHTSLFSSEAASTSFLIGSCSTVSLLARTRKWLVAVVWCLMGMLASIMAQTMPWTAQAKTDPSSWATCTTTSILSGALLHQCTTPQT